VFFDGTAAQLTDDVVRDIYGTEGLREFNEGLTSNLEGLTSNLKETVNA
jgi:hypothetical protein